MLKKISFLVAVLLSTALMGCEQQQKKPVQTAAAQTDEQMKAGNAPADSENQKGGKIENGQSGAMTPSQTAPTTAPAEAPAPQEPKKSY